MTGTMTTTNLTLASSHSETPPVLLSGGEAIARMIQAYGDSPIFGMCGFQLLPFYEACRQLGLPHFLINDERSGVFAADAYAKASGRIGFVDATLGPGTTNLVTGLVEALNAGTPLVAVVGDAHRDHAGKNMTQETDQLQILRSAVKAVIRIEQIARIPELMRRAIALASSGRPGPVVVDIPEDVAHDEHLFALNEFVLQKFSQRMPAHRSRPDAERLAEAAKILRSATRPLILAGGGVHLSQAASTLADFASRYSIPVAHTLGGKGSIACTDALSAGLFGRYDRIANQLIEEADVLLVVGCKLGEIATKRYTLLRPGAVIIHIESVADEIGRTALPTVSLWSDALLAIQDLDAALVDDQEAIRERVGAWAAGVPARMAVWRTDVSAKLHSRESPVSVARLMTEINDVLPADGFLVADGGFAAHWGGLLYDTKQPGRSFVPDRGFASIGYGVPGAIGVALAAEGRAVVSLTGDGGFAMSMGDLETARRLKLPFVVVIVNNAASGYIKSLQHLMYGTDSYHASDLSEIDYAAVARSIGCTGIRVEDPEELNGALRRALVVVGPVVVDVIVTRDPAKMLPGVDNRAVKVKKGDRIA
ncbi:thiamine pyrophosphate-binding protein [Cryobacterium sp. Y62]|uniref:thiamine pyrophosphate-binding protein n=1 Tax=Cryobacterium sp. Y62 TaxID=2048284 RepID=UPI0018EC0E63|nr:thiamine pyrophosphate-binding protein [Cryobacterium sp. Y62]